MRLNLLPRIIFVLVVGLLLPVQVSASDDDSRFLGLAEAICGYYGSTGANFQTKFNEAMKSHMGKFENTPNPTPKQIVDYLNRNKDKMTCGSGKNEKNYMMVAFDESAHIVLFQKIFRGQYIAQDRSARIDVNVVSYTGENGAPETLVDYLDRMLAENKRSEGILKQVKKLRKYFVIKLDGKKFSELPVETQAKYLH